MSHACPLHLTKLIQLQIDVFLNIVYKITCRVKANSVWFLKIKLEISAVCLPFIKQNYTKVSLLLL